jgi:hypothetical protein
MSMASVSHARDTDCGGPVPCSMDAADRIRMVIRARGPVVHPSTCESRFCPIRILVHTVARRAVVPSLASIVVAVASPNALGGQLVSARPASVSLTVVVPPHAQPDAVVTSEGNVALVRRTPTAIDLETVVGLASRPTARIEVRLGESWNADSTRVLVRNRRGEFEQLARNTSIVALDSPQESTGLPSPLQFRVESRRPVTASSLTIPVEFRVTVGAGDEFSVWTFSSLLRVDSER